jgi:hypothetical protein
MATTTPNFGWAVPTSTDLVKDGAVAIETLGDSIDASLVDLKGGTTGQVLAKASGTDMDFSWVAQDDSNAIQNALLTTTGDTIYASAASTPARIAIGTTGQVLTVSGGLPVWATPASGTPTAVSCSVFKGTQSISNNTSTAVTWDSENYDTDAIHDNATNNSRFTVPTGKGGKWLFQGNLIFGGNATGYRAAHIYKNGSIWSQYITSAVTAVNGGIQWQQTMNLSAGDYVQIFCLQDSGGALNLFGTGSIEYSNAQFTFLGA